MVSLLRTDIADTDATATLHAAHHDGLAAKVNGSVYNRVDIRAYIVDDGTTDNSAALTTMFGVSHASPVVYYLSAGLPVVIGAQVSGIASGSTILGEGANASVFHIVGVVVTSAGTNYDAFRISDTSHDVTFSGLGFTGENNPYSTPQAKNQSNAIRALGTTGKPADITVTDCAFKNLFGFAVHNDGTGIRWNVSNNDLVDCGSGLNINADYANISNNTMDRAWGIEAAGSYAIIQNNLIPHCQATGGAISLGGNQTVGVSTPGSIVSGNTILNGNGAGISVTESANDCLVTANYISRMARGGASVGGTVNPPAWVRFYSNTISSCGAYGASTGFTALDVEAAANTSVQGNVMVDEPVTPTTVTDGATSTGTDGLLRKFTTAQATFDSTWIHSAVTVAGAGTSGTSFVSLIESVIDAHNVTLLYPAATAVTAATAYLASFRQRYGVHTAGSTAPVIVGNTLSNYAYDVEFNAVTGIVFYNNIYTVSKVSILNGATVAADTDAFADRNARPSLIRPPVTSQPSGAGNFTVATGAALNGGTAVRNTGTDICGQINYSVITGATAGTLFTVTFGRAMTGAKIYVVPISTASITAAAGLYISATSTTAFTVGCTNAHAATAAVGFQFMVMQS
jgi:parallel beta-helix repeat protein